MIVTGGRGSGKSNVLSGLATFFTNNPRCVAHSEILRCGDISDNSLVDILKALTEVFQRAAKNSPSLVFLDDLDKICPSVHDHTHAGSDGKFGLISLHLKRLLQSSLERATESFEAARRVCNHSSSHRNSVFNYSDNCVGVSLAETQEVVSYHAEEVVALAQCRKVFVVASAESAVSIATELTSYPDCLLGDEVRIQPFTGSDRVFLLQSALAKLGNPVDDVILTSSSSMRDELLSIMEGFTIADVKDSLRVAGLEVR
jgi:SpoVK/Ycf46/Vps4 family AAA+-type ATPase